MIAATSIMNPLPVRPVGTLDAIAPDATSVRPASGTMHPLPVLPSDRGDMMSALRTAAYDRMLARLGLVDPLPVVDPSI